MMCFLQIISHTNVLNNFFVSSIKKQKLNSLTYSEHCQVTPPGEAIVSWSIGILQWVRNIMLDSRQCVEDRTTHWETVWVGSDDKYFCKWQLVETQAWLYIYIYTVYISSITYNIHILSRHETGDNWNNYAFERINTNRLTNIILCCNRANQHP